MNWYLQSGEKSDTVFASKVELARNINGFKFQLSVEDRKKLIEKIQDNLFNIGYDLKLLKLEDMDDLTVETLIEKNLIDSRFSKLTRNLGGAILINDDENICIEIGGENHLKIQVFASGLNLKNAMQLAKEIDVKIGECLDYAVSKKFGYLTKGFENVGTGLTACVKLHLPALTLTRNIDKIMQVVSSFGINAYTSKGDIFEMLNQRTLGLTENEIISNLQMVVEKVITQEKEARKILEKDSIKLEDKIYRSYGVLSNCRRITSKETLELLSDIKLGTDLGVLDELTDAKVLKLYLYSMPANLQKYTGEQLDIRQRDIKRAEVIKQILKEG